MNQTPFIVGFVIMSLASLAIYAKGSKEPPLRNHTYFHATVPFIAATAYLAMTFGLGDVIKSDGTTTLVARYLDWSVTTPILLTGLVMAALHERREASGFLVAIITLDVLMIFTGLISSLATVPAMKWIWFGWSTAAFLGVLYILWAPLKTISDGLGGPMTGAYTKNRSFLTVVWVLYPIVFVLGPEGARTIGSEATAWAILVLDVVAKVVYAFVSASNLESAWRQSGRQA